MKIITHLRGSGLVSIINGIRAKRITSRTGVFVSVGLATVVTALVGTALATPGAGIVSATVVASASFVDPVDMKLKTKGEHHKVLHAPDAQETVIQQVIIAPGGSTGWHSHPGPVVVLIKAGQLSFFSSEDPSCTATIYSAGQAFIDPGQGHVHLGRNLGSENVELWAVYFDVPTGGPFRLDAANPGNCGF